MLGYAASALPSWSGWTPAADDVEDVERQRGRTPPSSCAKTLHGEPLFARATFGRAEPEGMVKAQRLRLPL